MELQTVRLLAAMGERRVEVVTYRQRQAEHPFLDDLLSREPAPGQALWIVSWGFDVPPLLRRLRGRPVVPGTRKRIGAALETVRVWGAETAEAAWRESAGAGSCGALTWGRCVARAHERLRHRPSPAARS